jgi:hypothetical protein
MALCCETPWHGTCAVRQVGTGIADAHSIRATKHAGDNGPQRQRCGFADISVTGRLLSTEQHIVLARRFEAPSAWYTAPIRDTMCTTMRNSFPRQAVDSVPRSLAHPR